MSNRWFRSLLVYDKDRKIGLSRQHYFSASRILALLERLGFRGLEDDIENLEYRSYSVMCEACHRVNCDCAGYWYEEDGEDYEQYYDKLTK